MLDFVEKTYNRYYDEISLAEVGKHFGHCIKFVIENDYAPSEDNILRARLLTTGKQVMSFNTREANSG